MNSINKSTKNGIAITFDDGPDPKITPKILNILAQENIKATFFVIGNKVEANKELLLKIYNEGHTIGNHSYSHETKLTWLSTNKLKTDIENCSISIEKVIQQKPLLFRPPFGVTNPNYKRALNQLKMKSIGWSLRSLDTVKKSKEALYKKLTRQISNGTIVLFHDTEQVTLDILPDIIHFCKENGMNIVSLPKLIDTQVYE